MSKDFILFEKDHLTFKTKFYLLMDLLITNQTSSRMESVLFMGIFYIQIISGFFAKQIGVFDSDNSISDRILNYIQTILRLKDLFLNNYAGFQIAIYIIFGVVVIFSVYFLIICAKITKDSFYTYSEVLLNFYIKGYIFVGFNIILDLALSTLCFEESNINPNFNTASCSVSQNLPVFLISLILFLFSIFWVFFIQFFYCDSLYLSTSFYAKISCNYEIYTSLNSIFFSILLIQAKYLSKEIFLIYNVIISIIFFNFYLRRYMFYDRITNIMAGLFHIIYAWTSLFCLIFTYVDFKEKGIIYIVSSVIVFYFYFNLKYRLEENILLNTPFYKITNKHYLLYYIKNLIDKMNHIDESPEEKALLTGIMQMHIIECPNPQCLSKTKKKLYLPMTDEWSDRSKPLINDRVFLMNFVIVIMNFFISQSYYSPDMIINISLYYLQIIGNFCQSILYYKKVKEMKLSFQEQFSFIRLKMAISKALVEKLKMPNEPCYSLEDLNVTMYFKYEDLSQKFFDEMSNDVHLSLEFWRSFKNSQVDSTKTIDFNKIFHLTDKIRITKNKVEMIWEKLFKIFNGVNELFDLYLDYVEQLNDDDLLKRDLDAIKRKNENSTDHIQQNFYSLLFNKDTGIIIANGDKGKEGTIEKANNEIEAIFKFKPEELKGMNLSNLMPKLFEKNHKCFMEKYFEIGEKKVIDNRDLKTFAKDKDHSLLMVKLAIKLFPMLNESVYFVGLLIKENIDDIIFIDSKFNIQGMSMKLMKILQIDNKLLFQENDIPFYVICKKFVNFFKIFLQGKKQNNKDKSKKSSTLLGNEESSSTSNLPLENPNNINGNNVNDNGNAGIQGNLIDPNSQDQGQQNEGESDMHENIEINENIELEYEIRIPQFLIDYANSTSKKEQKLDLKLMKTTTEGSDNEMKEANESIEEFGESDLLVDDNISIAKTPIGEKVPLTANSPTKAGMNESNQTQKFDFGKQSEEEKEFSQKINKHKELFEKGEFNELEDYIDTCTADTAMNDFKFNFTFDRYKFGDKQMAYVVRCIDNKNDAGKSDEESVGVDDPKVTKYKKEKAEALKHLIELLDEEKKQIDIQTQEFIRLSIEDKAFQTLLNANKEDINKMSMIHGQKKEEVLDDENSSQSSQAGYNADLCKKNRIEEIRSNTMKNVSNFYTLKYIKILVFFTGLCTLVFCGLYIYFCFTINDGLKSVSQLNIDLIQSSLWLSNLVSSLISLRTLFLFHYIPERNKYEMKTYIENNITYFDSMKENSTYWYEQIITNFGKVESEIGNFVKNSTDSFWDSTKVTYSYIGTLDDSEAFPLGLSQVLADINSLLKLNEFNPSQPSGSLDDNQIIDFIGYLGQMSIENAYRNLIPSQYLKLKTLPGVFQDYNSGRMTLILITILIYSGVIIIECVIYGLFLMITNKNMGEGLEKVTKIKVEKIEDTMKRIESFNTLLKKFRDKDIKIAYDEGKDLKKDNHDLKNENKNNSSGFNSDSKKHKKLKILSYSYLQTLAMLAVLIGFLIPIYIITLQMVNSTNQIINVENYMFGKTLIASASTVKVKCMMSQCDIGTELVYNDLVNKSQIQIIVQGISIFPELNDFYNNKFLLNACETAFDKTIDPEKYDLCMKDVLIQSANNTDSLLKLIDETVDNIYKESEMKKDDKYKLYNSSSFYDLENVFYKYIAPVSDNFSKVVVLSLENYLNTQKIIIIILLCLFGVIVVCLCLYIGFFFVKRLIHLLSVSRCILRIIPTTVINSTQELESWIENKY